MLIAMRPSVNAHAMTEDDITLLLRSALSMTAQGLGCVWRRSLASVGPSMDNRDKNFTRAKMERRLAQIDASVAVNLSE
jgi:hypothetical protein